MICCMHALPASLARLLCVSMLSHGLLRGVAVRGPHVHSAAQSLPHPQLMMVALLLPLPLLLDSVP